MSRRSRRLSPRVWIRALRSSGEIKAGFEESSFGGRVAGRETWGKLGDSGSSLCSITDNRGSRSSALVRAVRCCGTASMGRGDSNRGPLVIESGYKDDSEFRFDSADTYAES